MEQHKSFARKSAAVALRVTLLAWAAFILYMLAAALAGNNAFAQQLKVATGSPKGTYSAMFNEINSICSSSIPLIVQNTNGSMENVNLLVGNQVNAAFVQTDVLYYRARTEDLANIKTLIALHPEEVHVLAPAESKLKAGGTLGIGAKPVVFSTINDLAGHRVGAVGGSAITAQVIRLQAEIAFNVVEYPTNEALLKAMQDGHVEAGVLVGGSPLSIIAGLGPTWKLLAFPEATVSKLKGVYRPTRLNYNSMRAMGVPSVATDALFVTRQYKTAKIVEGLSRLRQCIAANLDELKETTGTHPKWQSVEADNKGKWSWYELPAVK